MDSQQQPPAAAAAAVPFDPNHDPNDNDENDFWGTPSRYSLFVRTLITVELVEAERVRVRSQTGIDQAVRDEMLTLLDIRDSLNSMKNEDNWDEYLNRHMFEVISKLTTIQRVRDELWRVQEEEAERYTEQERMLEVLEDMLALRLLPAGDARRARYRELKLRSEDETVSRQEQLIAMRDMHDVCNEVVRYVRDHYGTDELPKQ